MCICYIIKECSCGASTGYLFNIVTGVRVRVRANLENLVRVRVRVRVDLKNYGTGTGAGTGRSGKGGTGTGTGSQKIWMTGTESVPVYALRGMVQQK